MRRRHSVIQIVVIISMLFVANSALCETNVQIADTYSIAPIKYDVSLADNQVCIQSASNDAGFMYIETSIQNLLCCMLKGDIVAILGSSVSGHHLLLIDVKQRSILAEHEIVIDFSLDEDGSWGRSQLYVYPDKYKLFCLYYRSGLEMIIIDIPIDSKPCVSSVIVPKRPVWYCGTLDNKEIYVYYDFTLFAVDRETKSIVECPHLDVINRNLPDEATVLYVDDNINAFCVGYLVDTRYSWFDFDGYKELIKQRTQSSCQIFDNSGARLSHIMIKTEFDNYITGLQLNDTELTVDLIETIRYTNPSGHINAFLEASDLRSEQELLNLTYRLDGALLENRCVMKNLEAASKLRPW